MWSICEYDYSFESDLDVPHNWWRFIYFLLFLKKADMKNKNRKKYNLHHVSGIVQSSSMQWIVGGALHWQSKTLDGLLKQTD